MAQTPLLILMALRARRGDMSVASVRTRRPVRLSTSTCRQGAAAAEVLSACAVLRGRGNSLPACFSLGSCTAGAGQAAPAVDT